ncbi:MAG TPA: tetratricopeptide repeat protein [Isosphaeraceae bacterium]|nr:tetratricopeptide repeat protein [Isosphaeraceae bacterium]
MKTIFADYNAATESGYLCLGFKASQAEIAEAHLEPGDWAWLSDGEVVVGAQLAIDDRYGLVGVPDWDAIVHLDEEGASDVERVRAELNPLLTKAAPSIEDESRILELLAQLDHFGPANITDAAPGMFAFRRALALRRMGKLGLALVEADEARRASPDDERVLFVCLDLLRLEDLPCAVKEAERIANCPTVPAQVLAACINILATQAEQVADGEFESVAGRVLDWCQRLDQAPGRDQAGESLLGLSYFNRGLVHLRAGRISQARQSFERARQIYPAGPMLDEAAGLEIYDRHTREVASRVRAIAERWSPPTPIAA